MSVKLFLYDHGYMHVIKNVYEDRIVYRNGRKGAAVLVYIPTTHTLHTTWFDKRGPAAASAKSRGFNVVADTKKGYSILVGKGVGAYIAAKLIGET